TELGLPEIHPHVRAGLDALVAVVSVGEVETIGASGYSGDRGECEGEDPGQGACVHVGPPRLAERLARPRIETPSRYVSAWTGLAAPRVGSFRRRAERGWLRPERQRAWCSASSQSRSDRAMATHSRDKYFVAPSCKLVRRLGIEPRTCSLRDHDHPRQEAMVAQRILKTDGQLRGPPTGTGGYARGRKGAKNGTTRPPRQRRLRPTRVLLPMGTSMALRFLIVVLLFCALGLGAGTIVKAGTRDALMLAAAPDTATLAGAARDSAIRWQFDTHG